MKKLKPFDYVLIAGVIILAFVFVMVLAHKNKMFSKSPVEETKKIAFQVMLRGVTFTSDKSPFEVGEKSFITIRNVPYTELEVIDVVYQPKKIMMPTGDTKNPFIVVNDYSVPYQYDFVVTLIDDAKITKDGAVVGGNKIKTGLPIVLEGFDYRFAGTVANVKVLSDEDLAVVKQMRIAAKKAKLEENEKKFEEAQKANKNKQIEQKQEKQAK